MAVRTWARRMGHQSIAVPDVGCAASESELLGAASAHGISLGSHSWSHPNLTRVGSAELEAELQKPLAWLRERVSKALPWIAYPYGQFNQVVSRAAAAAGYEAALGVSGGWIPRELPDPLALPRVNIPRGLTRQGFVLRAAGLLAG